MVHQETGVQARSARCLTGEWLKVAGLVYPVNIQIFTDGTAKVDGKTDADR